MSGSLRVDTVNAILLIFVLQRGPTARFVITLLRPVCFCVVHFLPLGRKSLLSRYCMTVLINTSIL